MCKYSTKGMKKVVGLAAFFAFTPLLIVALTLYSLSHRYATYSQSNPEKNIMTDSVSYQAVPETNPGSVLGIEAKDGRIEVLEEFFERYDSPLAGHGQLIVDLADEHGLDYRLIPAIAMKESTLCKKIPKNSYNCWGYGIYGKKVTRFENYAEGIDTVTRGLAKNYVAQGYTSPEEIMSKYTPSSNGSWAETVNLIMNRLDSAL